jgi:hypothetical protein
MTGHSTSTHVAARPAEPSQLLPLQLTDQQRKLNDCNHGGIERKVKKNA